ncbi:hypothetical protein AAMO2058_000372800, partial [Amorphochlora amoebiformis]
ASMPKMARKLGFAISSNLHAEFSKIDVDGGGLLLYNEFANYLHTILKKEDSSSQAVKSARVSKKNRKVSRSEGVEAKGPPPLRSGPKMRDTLKMTDERREDDTLIGIVKAYKKRDSKATLLSPKPNPWVSRSTSSHANALRDELKKADKEPTITLRPRSFDIKKIDWKAFDRRLPTDGSEPSFKILEGHFKAGDGNSNGYVELTLTQKEKKRSQKLFPVDMYPLSVAEIEKLLMVALKYEKNVKIAVKKSVHRAHRAARGYSQPGKSTSGDDYVELNEFPIFVRFFRDDLKLLTTYTAMDTNDDMRLDFSEFKAMVPKLSNKLGIHLPDNLESIFLEIDRDGGGLILYDEFASYILEHSSKSDPDLRKLLEQSRMGDWSANARDKSLKTLPSSPKPGGRTPKKKKQKRKKKKSTLGRSSGSSVWNSNLRFPHKPAITLVPRSFDIQNIDYKVFDERMPSDGSSACLKILKKHFVAGDGNANGLLSVAEMETCLMLALKCDNRVKTAMKLSIQRAFRACRGLGQGKSNCDYVEFEEFLPFIRFLRYDLNVARIYKAMDIDDDMRLQRDNFKLMMPEYAKELGLKIPEDLDEEFDVMDSDGRGMVLYNEFASYCLLNEAGNPSKELLNMGYAAHPESWTNLHSRKTAQLRQNRIKRKKRKPKPKSGFTCSEIPMSFAEVALSSSSDDDGSSKSKLKTARSEIEILKKKLAEKAKKLPLARIQTLNKTKELEEKLKMTLDELESSKNSLAIERQRAKKGGGKTENQLQAAMDEIGSLSSGMEMARNRISDLQRKLEKSSGLRDEISELEGKVRDQADTIRTLNENIKDLENRLNTAKDLAADAKADSALKVLAVESEIKSIKAKLQASQQEVKGLVTQIDPSGTLAEARGKADEMEKLVNALNKENGILKSRERDTDKNKKKLFAAVEEKNGALRREIEELRKEVRRVKGKAMREVTERFREEIEELKESIEREKKMSKSWKLRAQRAIAASGGGEEELKSLRNAYEDAKSQVFILKGRISRADNRLQDSIGDHDREVQGLQREIERLQSRKKSEVKTSSKLRRDLAKARESLEESKEKLEEADEEISQLQAQIENLHMKRDTERFHGIEGRLKEVENEHRSRESKLRSQLVDERKKAEDEKKEFDRKLKTKEASVKAYRDELDYLMKHLKRHARAKN